MSDKFQNKYRIPSARADWHEYDGGVYFVTICTTNKKHYFGEIVDKNDENKMMFSEIGKCASDNFENVSVHYPYAEIPLYTVMPNHIHAIVVIHGKTTPYNRTDLINTRHNMFIRHIVETRRATRKTYTTKLNNPSIYGKPNSIIQISLPYKNKKSPAVKQDFRGA